MYICIHIEVKWMFKFKAKNENVKKGAKKREKGEEIEGNYIFIRIALTSPSTCFTS